MESFYGVRVIHNFCLSSFATPFIIKLVPSSWSFAIAKERLAFFYPDQLVGTTGIEPLSNFCFGPISARLLIYSNVVKGNQVRLGEAKTGKDRYGNISSETA